MKTIKYLLIALFIVTNCNFVLAPVIKTDKKMITEQIILHQKEVKYYELYAQSLDKLKSFEGLRLMPYFDSKGMTIGYGHAMRSYEHFTSITNEKAEALLRVDFEGAMQSVERATGYNRLDNPEKVLALAHFVFNFGEDAFNRSTMLKNIRAEKPIDNEIRRWVHADIHGEKVVLSCLKERREYELKLYYS